MIIKCILAWAAVFAFVAIVSALWVAWENR